MCSKQIGNLEVYFVELPKDVQERFHDAAQLARALDTKTPADLMKQAESALQGNNFAYTAALFNQITEEYPASPQAKTVRELYSFLRDKQARQDGPFTAIEAQRLRSVMDAIVSIKRNHRTATPQKRAAMESLWAPRYFKMKTTGWIRFQPLAQSFATLKTKLFKASDSVLPWGQG